MAKQKVSNTAIGAAICRLIEQYQPQETRLFDDPLVKNLVGTPVRMMMQFAGMRNFTLQRMDAITHGIYGAQICRTRLIDEAVQAGISAGIAQLVILGAGLDTRPYRLPGMERIKVFEVDLALVQDEKKARLQKLLGRLPENVVFIPIDFDTQALDEALSGSTFDPSKPAIFIWEGVTQYLTEGAVRQTLSSVGRSAPGSILVFTYVLKSIIERRSDIQGADEMLDTVARQSPWIFGLETAGVSEYLQAFALTLISDQGQREYQEKYLQPLQRHVDIFPGERTVQAVVTGS
jgi:methyltransferase (TIGR00027 family)